MNATEKSTRRDQWLEIVEKQEKSGLSQTEFCKQNNRWYHSLRIIVDS